MHRTNCALSGVGGLDRGAARADCRKPAPGSVVFSGIEGTRPVLVEFQALVAPTPQANPRRTVVGWDGSRLAMILAVLEARCGIPFAGRTKTSIP